MKKLWFIAVGMLGLMPLQGCMASTGEDSGEQTATAGEALSSSCSSNNGLNPTRAALAVAMADELGRWQPATDLVVNNGLVGLSASAVCLKNNCMNTKALLGQQDWHIATWIDQAVFNPTTYNQDLQASFNRQATKIDDLTRNHPERLPPAHKLKKVAGPTDLGTGACGAHYVFQADHLDGTPLSSTEASNLGNSLCYYGYGSCGDNPYVAFVVTGQNCPSGRTCVAVDPTYNDTGAPSSSGGSIPSYPMNRLYDPAYVQLGKQCLLYNTTTLATMISKCAAYPSTCNYLYCTLN